MANSSRIRNLIDRIKRWYEINISEAPWIKAVGIVAPLTGVLIYLNNQVPKEYSINLADANFYVIFCSAMLVIYFLLVSVFFQARLTLERQLRNMEQSFRYDRRGTLYNGGQPNIAFRVVTFKGVLEGLAKYVNFQVLQGALLEAGAIAAADFSNKLPSIYDQDVQARKGSSPWSGLSIDEKLSHWMDYDSATGWGILSADQEDGIVVITVNHQKGLVEGSGGLLFACFLAGYCRTVLSSIVAGHRRGPFRDYSTATLTALTPKGETAVEFRFSLN